MEKDITTEEKIKEAARKIFHQKGFAGTRTRDIAEEAGINLALLNYYYRSKEKLFELVMEESIKHLFTKVQIILNNSTTSLSEKIDRIINMYIDLLLEDPNIPIFVLGEIQANPDKFKQKIGISRNFLNETIASKQIHEHLQSTELKNINAVHFIINILALTIFPFVAKPLIRAIGNVQEEEYAKFIEERRVLIPIWIKSMLKLQ